MSQIKVVQPNYDEMANLAEEPRIVGITFAQQYYTVLKQSPGELHKFYAQKSELSRPEVDVTMSNVETLQAINEKLLSLESHNGRCQIQILTIDSQFSLANRVIVFVSGILSGEGQMRKKFNQTFFLAPQEKGGYYLLSDLLKYVDEDSTNNNKNNAADDTPEASLPGKWHGIFVENLPMNVTVEELDKLFRQFGPIKRDGIRVGSLKERAICYAYVDFESAESMKNAIKVSPIEFGSRLLPIEEEADPAELKASRKKARKKPAPKFPKKCCQVCGKHTRGNCGHSKYEDEDYVAKAFCQICNKLGAHWTSDCNDPDTKKHEEYMEICEAGDFNWIPKIFLDPRNDWESDSSGSDYD